MKNLYNKVKDLKKLDFSAKFVCVISLKLKNGQIFTYSGEVKGKLVWPPVGKNGFGYDPFFVPKNYRTTFGQMEHRKKILIDHRYNAFKKLIKEHQLCN